MQDNTVTGNTTLYIEKKALELLESCQDPETDFPQIFYLLGREYHLGIQRVFVIRSILEGPIQEDKDLHVTPEELRSVDQQRSLQYPGLRLMGWALHQPGQGVRAFSRHSRCHVQFFRQTSILLLKDSLNNTQDFYLWDGSSFHLINNYQIYKEQELDLDLTDEARPVELWKETPVQNESMLARAMRDNPPASKPLHFFNEETPDFLRHYTQKKPSPHYHSKEPRQFEGQLQSIVDPPSSKKTLKEKLKEDSHSFQLLTSISAVVLFITIIMGVLMFRNLSTLSSIQTNIETINDRISYIEQSEIVMEEVDEE